MTKPKMIIFDFGQTIMTETFNGIKGIEALMKFSVSNKSNCTIEEIQDYINILNDELGRFNVQNEKIPEIEITNAMFQSYVFEKLGISFNLSLAERDRIFWKAASPGIPTDGISDFLIFLKKQNIRTGIISNIPYQFEVVKERVFEIVPNNNFEFIICSSQCLFRKPNKRIFELGIEKSELPVEDIWYVGDNYYCDILGAKKVGITPVWYKGALKKKDIIHDETTKTVNSWKELENFIIGL